MGRIHWRDGNRVVGQMSKENHQVADPKKEGHPETAERKNHSRSDPEMVELLFRWIVVNQVKHSRCIGGREIWIG